MGVFAQVDEHLAGSCGNLFELFFLSGAFSRFCEGGWRPIEGCLAGHDQCDGLRIENLGSFPGLDELTVVEERDRDVVLHAEFGDLFGCEFAVLD